MKLETRNSDHKCDCPLLHSLSKSLFLLFNPNVCTHFLNVDNCMRHILPHPLTGSLDLIHQEYRDE